MRFFYGALGAPAAALLVWYAYTVAYELNKPTMSAFEADLKARIAALTERAQREGFKAEDVDRCQNMIAEYTTPKGWFYSDADLYQLVGLPRTATREQMNERCIFYAKAVATMEQVARHVRHAFVCDDALLDLGGNGRYYIKADPTGRGAISILDSGGERRTAIPKNASTVLNAWQVYNVGDGCIIVGLSKTNTFRMSGKILRQN